MQTVKRMSTFSFPAYVVVVILALALAGIAIAQPLTLKKNPTSSRVVYNTNVFDDRMIAALKESRVQVLPSITVNSHPSQQERLQEKLVRLFAPSTIAVAASTNALDDQMIAALKESKAEAQVSFFTVHSYLTQQAFYQKLYGLLIAPSTSATVVNTSAFDDQMIAALKAGKVQAGASSFTVNSFLTQDALYQKLYRLLIAPSTSATIVNTNAFDDQMIAALKESEVQTQAGNSHPSQQERLQNKLERLIDPQ